MTLVREPDADGFAERAGVKVHFEVYGEGGPTILLLPTWTIIHKRFWKLQVPYLSRHHRVVTYDGAGNGLSDRPLARFGAVEPVDESEQAGLHSQVPVLLPSNAGWPS